jgi:imidazolonepropionase
MVEGGLTPHEGISAATAGSARALGLGDVGTIEAGKAADMVVWNSDPLADITTVTRPEEIWMVIAGGRVSVAPPADAPLRGESIATGV